MKSCCQWNSATINNDKPVNNAWITNNTGATNINANSIGSVTPTINAEMELAINQPYTCFSEQIQRCDTSPTAAWHTKHHNWEEPCLISTSNTFDCILSSLNLPISLIPAVSNQNTAFNAW